MRFYEIREATLFKKSSDIKYQDVVNQLIDQGQTFALGPNGQDGTFVANKGQTVSSNTQVLYGTGTLNGEEITQVKANLLFKSPQIINTAAGRDPSDVSSSSAKEAYVVKPSQIFKDEKFSAAQVFSEVIDNPTLQQSEIGMAIIEMAKTIQQGSNPNFKDLPKEFQPAIRDYAGEYLGVLALIKGTANFPTRDKWLQHLGVNALDDIMIYFPPESNNPLGDSEGYFQNAETGNVILISSKGGKKGAPPSLSGLKIPENLRTPKYQKEIEIIEKLQQSSAVRQPFEGINLLLQYAPDSLHPAIREAGPVTDQDMVELQSLMNKRKYEKIDYGNELDSRFVSVVDTFLDYDRTNDRATPGGMVHYSYNKALIEAVNKNNALPNFEPMAREILQQNFIQIFARPKGMDLEFDVLWPNKDLATGKIELYSKSSSTDPGKGKLSFSVT